MLSYQLCKRLKDAGFNQHESYVIPLGGIYISPTEEMSLGTNDKNFMYCPSLSELIEACGRIDNNYFALCADKRAGEWEAMYTDGFGKCPFSVYGETPEEAVAELWLVLHNK